MGKAAPPSQTTTQMLSPEQREIMGLAMPGIRDFAASVPERYKGQTIAGFDPSQTAAQQALLGASGAQAGLAKNAADTSNFWTGGDVWNPKTNAGLSGAIDAATRPIMQTYNEQILPGIRESAVTGSNFGSSRQGVAEGIAGRGAATAVGDTASKMAQDLYKTNVDAQIKALGLLPQTQTAQTAAGLTTGAVGDVRQAMAQSQLNKAANDFNYDQFAPFLQSKEIMSLVQGLPGGSTQTVGSTPGFSAQQAIGGGLSGAMMGAQLGSIVPGIGTLAGAGIGALGGGVLPFVFK